MIWRRRFGIELAAVCVTIAVVSVLGVYQYRWTGEISRTEEARLRNSLAASVRSFDQEFSYDLQQLSETFELGPAPDASAAENMAAKRREHWLRTAPRPEFVDGVYIWRPASAGREQIRTLAESDPRRGDAWPAALEPLRPGLAKQFESASAIADDRDAVYYPWTFFADAPALARPIFQIPPGRRAAGAGAGIRALGILIVALDREFVERQYFPELVERSFGGAGQRSFVVTIRTARQPYRTIYISDGSASPQTKSSDAAVNLLALVSEEARRRGHPAVQASALGDEWELVAQHPSGSLEQAVASWRRRNLAISLGLLAILAGSMGLIFLAAWRARALARMQMEFVAGVSHELCTPLAVINTAAENLADGVVEDAAQTREYGGLIRAQGRRLGRLVDEVLLFTAGRFGLSGYDVEPVEVGSLIEQSLSTAETNLHDAGFNVTREIGEKLPAVLADPSAAITCIENLVSNAIKYSNSNKWIAIRAYQPPATNGSKPEVRVSIEDKGMGIGASDLPHIFEPFYRVQAVKDHQIRGVGLGLSLVKRMMEDMGGRVSVKSEPGRGTEFTLHFRAAD